MLFSAHVFSANLVQISCFVTTLRAENVPMSCQEVPLCQHLHWQKLPHGTFNLSWFIDTSMAEKYQQISFVSCFQTLKHSLKQPSPAYQPTQPPFYQPPDMKVSIHERILNIIWLELYKCQYGAYDRFR